jgi:sulfopyruvate decarboxylase alpha subunit
MSAAAIIPRVFFDAGPVPPWARDLAAGLARASVGHAVYVPDTPLSHVLRALEHDVPHLRRTLATREEEALGIAAGSYLGGQRAAVLMQSSGVGNCFNAIASLLLAYQVPVLMIVSMRGEAGEWNAAQTPMGRALPGLLDRLGVPHVRLDNDARLREAVEDAAALAFGTRHPVACLLPRRRPSPGPPGERVQ